MGDIKEKRETFYFNNYVFIINKIEKLKKSLRIKKYLQNLLVKKTYTGNLIEKLKINNIKELDKIKVSYISN